MGDLFTTALLAVTLSMFAGVEARICIGHTSRVAFGASAAYVKQGDYDRGFGL